MTPHRERTVFPTRRLVLAAGAIAVVGMPLAFFIVRAGNPSVNDTNGAFASTTLPSEAAESDSSIELQPARVGSPVDDPRSSPPNSTTSSVVDSATSTTTSTGTTIPPSSTTTRPAPTTTGPIAGVSVLPGQDLQTVVDSNPPATTFVLAEGIHIVNRLQPRSGDVFVGEVGAIVSGNGQFDAAFVGPAADVTIRNLIIERYITQPQKAAVHPSGPRWLIEGNEVRENLGAGIWVTSESRVLNNSIHHNHQIGLLANGAQNAVVAENEIAFNNYLNEYEMVWEAGGTKFISTLNLVVRGNFVHDNQGPGLWTDANNVGTIYDSNVVLNNAGPGIFHEISYSGLIVNNRVEGNAFPFYRGGILVANSSDVEVRGNTVRGNDGGILGIHDDRGGFELRNLYVHDNVISHSVGWTGIRQNIGDNVVYSWGHQFTDNIYESDPGQRLWYWMNTEYTLTEWQGYGLG